VNRYSVLLLAATLACSLLSAQGANPLSTEAKQSYTGIKNNLISMAEKMPEEHYSFKPTPEIRSFGQLVGHVADAQARGCSAVTGDSKAVNAASRTTKTELVAALKDSFAICDTAFDSLTDTTANEMIKTPRGQRSKLSTLWGTVSHSNEEYGYMAVYLRLKNIVPPSSERR
jgi:hypothetical protein